MLDEHHLLFSETKTACTWDRDATASRSEHHEVYFPTHERAMAHYRMPRPIAMGVGHRDGSTGRSGCRVASFHWMAARQAGRSDTQGYCTGAGWSPDGRWMYFTVAVDENPTCGANASLTVRRSR